MHNCTLYCIVYIDKSKSYLVLRGVSWCVSVTNMTQEVWINEQEYMQFCVKPIAGHDIQENTPIFSWELGGKTL